MKKLIATSLLALTATTAFAEPSCEATAIPKPVWEAIKSFEDANGVVASFKINDGMCYEIYGSVDGQNMEVFFDPATGEELERINQ